MAARRWLFLFTEGDPHRRDLLGGKGAGLAEMTQAGLDYVSASSYRIPVARLAAPAHRARPA